MPIPDWTLHGLLPAGIFDATLNEIESRYCINTHRQELWQDGLRFLSDLLDKDLHYPICIGGSFTTDKALPADIDLALDVTDASELHQFRAVKLFSEHRIIQQTFRVDYYPNLSSSNNFFYFFQYIGEKTAIQKGLQPKDFKGVLRVKTWADGLSR